MLIRYVRGYWMHCSRYWRKCLWHFSFHMILWTCHSLHPLLVWGMLMLCLISSGFLSWWVLNVTECFLLCELRSHIFVHCSLECSWCDIIPIFVCLLWSCIIVITFTWHFEAVASYIDNFDMCYNAACYIDNLDMCSSAMLMYRL